jgi:hypothetical protein
MSTGQKRSGLLYFPQSDLPGGRTGGVNHPSDGIEQPEGAEAQGVDDDEELQEAGP